MKDRLRTDIERASIEVLKANYSYWFYGKLNAPQVKCERYPREYYEEYFIKTGFPVYTDIKINK